MSLGQVDRAEAGMAEGQGAPARIESFGAAGFGLWRLFAGLYLTQFASQAFLMISLLAVMRRHGAAPSTLGAIWLISAFWIFKFLWAPIVDRLPLMGARFKGWLILTQSGMLMSLISMSPLSPPRDFAAIMALGIAHSLFASIQDVASDGLFRFSVSPKDRPFGLAVQTGAGLCGNMVGGGLVMAAYPSIGWGACSAILAALVAACLAQVLLFKEPRKPRLSAPSGFTRLGAFWREDSNLWWLLSGGLMALGIGLAYGAIPLTLSDSNLSIELVGLSMNVFGSISGILGAAAFSAAMGRISRRSAFSLASVTGAAAFLAVAAMGSRYPLSPFGAAVSAQIFFLGVSAAMIAAPVIMMDRSSVLFPSTDFTVQFCAFAALQYAGAGSAAVLMDGFGLSATMAIAAALCGSASLAAKALRALGKLDFRNPSAQSGARGDLSAAGAPDLARGEKSA